MLAIFFSTKLVMRIPVAYCMSMERHSQDQVISNRATERATELAARTTCSIDEAAAFLGIGRSTAYAAARDGSLPTLRLSHRLLVPTAKLLVMVGLEGAE